MASTRFSAGLVSLYPRESEELSLLLEKHGIASGQPQAIYSFPEILISHPALQRDLSDFVLNSRTHPRGPVSRGAMMHLLLLGIGGPEAVELGPEADEATRSITLFLEQLGGWPEDAFADIADPGSEDGFGFRPSARPSATPTPKPRSLAASLASQRDHHDEPGAPDLPASTLQEIVLALGRLEENQRATTARLEQMSSRLQLMGSVAPDVASDAGPDTQAALTETPAPAFEASPEPPVEAAASDFVIGAKTIIPTPILSQLSSAPVNEILLEIPDPAALSKPPAVAERTGADLTAPPVADLAAPQQTSPVTYPVVSDTPPRREWNEIFAAPPERPKRTIAVLPVVIACLLLAAALVAGVIYFLHSEGTPSQAVSDNASAPAPSLSEPADSSSTSVSPAPRSATSSRTPARPQTAATGRSEPPGNANRQDRVLGARETYEPRSSAEAFPQPRQPAFVAASTMDARLVYAPAAQHPRIAGLVGLSGMVVMEVIVDSDGTVDSVKVLGGHHLLRDAAVNAVRTWRYRPVLQNGRPVSVRTIVRMDFNKETREAKN